MKKIFKINEYRKAKVFIQDLPIIINKFDKITQELKKYDKYTPVKEILYSIKINRDWLNINLTKYKKILDNKDEID